MRMRADQVRVGHRLAGAVVTRVQPTLDWGVVRITVEHPSDSADLLPDGTFSYLPDDIVDVQRSAVSGAYAGSSTEPVTIPAVTAPDDAEDTRALGHRTATHEIAYRVEYQSLTGDGHIVVRSDDSVTTSMVGRAQELLQQQGIDARIRRIVPLDRQPVTRGTPGRVRRLS